MGLDQILTEGLKEDIAVVGWGDFLDDPLGLNGRAAVLCVYVRIHTRELIAHSLDRIELYTSSNQIAS